MPRSGNLRKVDNFDLNKGKKSNSFKKICICIVIILIVLISIVILKNKYTVISDKNSNIMQGINKGCSIPIENKNIRYTSNQGGCN